MIQNYIHTGEHRISIIKDHRYDGGNIRPLILPVVFYLIFKWIYSWVSSYPETIFFYILCIKEQSKFVIKHLVMQEVPLPLENNEITPRPYNIEKNETEAH